MPEMRQRVAQIHHASKVREILVRNYATFPAAPKSIGKMDAVRNVIDQKAGVEIGGKQVAEGWPVPPQNSAALVSAQRASSACRLSSGRV
jgi:hypothetical protein